MPTSEVGAILAELHARTGLSWSALADTIGASSGDYVRKVASGAKPGNNLAGVVRELMSTGEVSAAVPRRRAASGQIARVRASTRTAGTISRRPSDTAVTAPAGARRAFATAGGRMGWARTIEADRGAVSTSDFLDTIRAAGRGRRRVVLRAQVRPRPGAPAEWVVIGEKGGYRPADILARLRKGGSVQAWLADQMSGRKYTGDGNVLAVEVMAA